MPLSLLLLPPSLPSPPSLLPSSSPSPPQYLDDHPTFESTARYWTEAFAKRPSLDVSEKVSRVTLCVYHSLEKELAAADSFRVSRDEFQGAIRTFKVP